MDGAWWGTGLDWRMVRNKRKAMKACAEVVDSGPVCNTPVYNSAINQYTHAIHHQWTSLLVCNTPSGPDCRKYRVEQHSTIDSSSQCIHQTSPIPKEYAHMQWQSKFWKLCRGKSSAEGNCSVQLLSKTTTLNQFWSAVPLKKCTFIGDLKGAMAIHLNFPILGHYLEKPSG